MNIKIVLLSSLLILLFSLAFLWWKTGDWIQKGQTPLATGKHSYAIILGAKVNGSIPSRSLQYRLDAAVQYSHEYPNVRFVLSGGQGPDEQLSEAEAMKNYLIEKGIEESRLILETTSSSTYENILFSKKLLPDSIDHVTIITSDYHLARSRKIAHQLGLETDALAAKTPEVVKWKMTTRERAALIKTYLTGR